MTEEEVITAASFIPSGVLNIAHQYVSTERLISFVNENQKSLNQDWKDKNPEICEELLKRLAAEIPNIYPTLRKFVAGEIAKKL
jgi:hypothetical protein